MTETEEPAARPDQLRWRIVRELVWVAIALGFGWWVAGEWPTPLGKAAGRSPFSVYGAVGPNRAYSLALLALGWRYTLLAGWVACHRGGALAVRVAVFCAMVGAALFQVSLTPFDSASQVLFQGAMPSVSAEGFTVGHDRQFILAQATLVVMVTGFLLSVIGLFVAATRESTA